MNLLQRLYRDESGTVLSAELMMLVTLLAVGIIVAAKSFRDSAVTEFADFAQAIANLDQSYNVPDSAPGMMDGSGFADQRDFCDTDAATNPLSNNTKVNALCGAPSNFSVTPIVPADGRGEQ